jgi:hypothetical protein
MLDREGEVEVTARPRRGRGDDRLRQVGVRKGRISIEFQAHDLEVPAIAVDVLRDGLAAT